VTVASPGATGAPDASMSIKRRRTIWKFPLSTFLLFGFSAIDQSTDDKRACEKGPSYGGGGGAICALCKKQERARACQFSKSVSVDEECIWLRSKSLIDGFRNTILPRPASMSLHNTSDTT